MAGVSFVKNAVHDLVCIASAKVDIHAAVAAFQAGHPDREPFVTGRNRLFVIVECYRSVDAAGTAYEQFTLIFRIHVQQDLASEQAWFKPEGSDHAGLLFARKEYFYRTMLQSTRFKHSHGCRDAHAVVSAQGCSNGTHPIAIDNGFDRIVLEIMDRTAVLLRHHVEMSL